MLQMALAMAIFGSVGFFTGEDRDSCGGIGVCPMYLRHTFFRILLVRDRAIQSRGLEKAGSYANDCLRRIFSTELGVFVQGIRRNIHYSYHHAL